jgi:hypothetical protein
VRLLGQPLLSRLPDRRRIPRERSPSQGSAQPIAQLTRWCCTRYAVLGESIRHSASVRHGDLILRPATGKEKGPAAGKIMNTIQIRTREAERRVPK